MYEWEILLDNPSSRATRFLQEFIRHRPKQSVVSSYYRGQAKNLMVYGPGSIQRKSYILRHLRRGHVAMWDLGYWNRETGMRLSIDSMHPTADQLARSPTQGRRGFKLREDADPNGPIVLIGLGRKSVPAYDLKPFEWERRADRMIKENFPDREVIWRPKGQAIPFNGYRMDSESRIADLLKGASLVVCRHSNVAVDACIAGVPVICDDGAAFSLYRSNTSPTPEQRMDFLQRLSWWEWDRTEAGAAWEFIQEMCSG